MLNTHIYIYIYIQRDTARWISKDRVREYISIVILILVSLVGYGYVLNV